jgi:hypothetical protein
MRPRCAFLSSHPAKLPRVGVWIRGQMRRGDDSPLSPAAYQLVWGALGLFLACSTQRPLADRPSDVATDTGVPAVLVVATAVW